MKIKILKTISLILMIMNVYLAFFICGAPKDMFGLRRGFVTAYDPYEFGRQVVRLKSDAAAISEDGDEVVYAAGSELEVVECNSDGSLVIYGSEWNSDGTHRYLGRTLMTLSEPEYEEIREEVETEIRKETNRHKREEAVHKWFWYMYPDRHENVPHGLFAAFAVALADGLFYVFSIRRGKFKGFIIVNTLLCLAFVFFGLGSMKGPMWR